MRRFAILAFVVLLNGSALAAPLTQEQREILAHVVVSPDAWQAHNEAVTNDAAEAKARLDAKIDRWRSSYEEQKARLGANYKDRMARDLAAVVPPAPPPTNAELLAREMGRPVFGALVGAMAKQRGITEAAMRAAILAEME